MKLNELPKITIRKGKRVGRGYGSGKGGHTSGRGTKGQKVKRSMPLLFQGTKSKKSFVKRLPFLRGKGKFKSLSKKSFIVKSGQLNVFKKDETVDLKALIKKGLVPEFTQKVKILNDGKVEVALTVAVASSKGAKAEIEKAGGKLK